MQKAHGGASTTRFQTNHLAQTGQHVERPKRLAVGALAQQLLKITRGQALELCQVLCLHFRPNGKVQKRTGALKQRPGCGRRQVVKLQAQVQAVLAQAAPSRGRTKMPSKSSICVSISLTRLTSQFWRAVERSCRKLSTSSI